MVEIIPKEPLKSSKSSNILLYFSLALLFFSIATYFMFGLFVERSKKEHISLKQTLIEKEKEIESLEEKILPSQRRIDDFSFLIAQQLEASKFFTAFEKITHPQIWFSIVNLNLKEKRVTLYGQAQNLEALKQQISIFQNQDWIENVDLNLETETITKEKIDFNLFLIINPKFWAKR